MNLFPPLNSEAIAPSVDILCELALLEIKINSLVHLFTCREEHVQDLDDDRRADDTDHHHPHDQEEERQGLGAEAPQPFPHLLHPAAHGLRRGEGHDDTLPPRFNLHLNVRAQSTSCFYPTIVLY